MKATDGDPITATVNQFAALSGLGRTSIYELIKSGEIQSVTIGRRRLIIMESWRQYRLGEERVETKQPQHVPPIPKTHVPRTPKKPPPFIGNVVYFLEAPSARLIKIGTTGYADRRIRLLQGASPVSLRLLGCIVGSVNAERELHERFVKLRKHGEWFRDTGELRSFIETTLADRGLPINGLR